jgi:hypothetical protein
MNGVTVSMVQILSISESSLLQSSPRFLGMPQLVNPHHHVSASRQALSGPLVVVSTSVTFSSASAAMMAGLFVSSDPQMFAAAVTSSLSTVNPADFSSVVVSSLILGNVPGVSGVQNFTMPEPVRSILAPTSPGVSSEQNFTIPEPAPSRQAPASVPTGGLSSDLIAVIAVSAAAAAILIGGLVWWKLKSSSLAAVWPEGKIGAAAVKSTPALDAVKIIPSAWPEKQEKAPDAKVAPALQVMNGTSSALAKAVSADVLDSASEVQQSH